MASILFSGRGVDPRPVSDDELFAAFVNEGQKCNLAGTLNSSGQFTLMLGAGTGLASWANLALFGHITAQHVTMLVIDFQVFIRAEGADLWA